VYETRQNLIYYYVPSKRHSYLADFLLTANNIRLEAKGFFSLADRKKHKSVRKNHPDLDIRFIFNNANQKLYKGSKTTYGQWCDRNSFLWCHKVIPTEWVKDLLSSGG